MTDAALDVWPCHYCGETTACECEAAQSCPACGEFWDYCECMGQGCGCESCERRRAKA